VITVNRDGAIVDSAGNTLVAPSSFQWCTVLRRDECAVSLPDGPEANHRVIEVPRRPELLFSLLADNVRDELAIAAALHGDGTDGAALAAIQAELGLPQLHERNPLELSGGEKAKLAICIALMSAPDVLVLNDALDAVDTEMRPRVVQSLRRTAVRVIEITTAIPSSDTAADVIVVTDDAGHKLLSAQELQRRASEFLPRYPDPRPPRADGTLVAQALDIEYAFAGSFRLTQISVEVRQGQMVRLVGRNGSGKTTFLKALAQLLLPHAGSVAMFDPQDSARSLAIRYPVRRHTAGVCRFALYQFQEPSHQLYCATVYEELLETARRCYAVNPRDAKKVAEELGLESVLEDSPWDLTEGQRRMLALGSILCANPPLVLADEPTAQLDPVQRSRVAWALRRYVSAGGACVFIAHDDSFSASITDYEVYMPGEAERCRA
jgi:energy-coupling factor transporter ATP-binding protein EcfA2